MRGGIAAGEKGDLFSLYSVVQHCGPWELPEAKTPKSLIFVDPDQNFIRPIEPTVFRRYLILKEGSANVGEAH